MPTLLEILGNNPTDCKHNQMNAGGISIIAKSIPSEREDFEHLAKALNLDESVTSVRICSNCQDELPSRKRVQEQRRVRHEQHEREAEEAQEQKRQEAKDSGEKLYKCSDCEQLLLESELVQVRHCTHCELDFNGTESGRNCAECNRPFTSKLHDLGCPECVTEDECEEVEIT